MGTEVPRQSPCEREGEGRTEEDIRDHLQMETLGEHRVEYAGRPHPPLPARNATRLGLVRHADTERQVLRLAQEEDQTGERSLRKTIALGTRLLRLHHRPRRAPHTPLRQAPVPPQPNRPTVSVREAEILTVTAALPAQPANTKPPALRPVVVYCLLIFMFQVPYSNYNHRLHLKIASMPRVAKSIKMIIIQKSYECPTIGKYLVFMPKTAANKVKGKTIKAKRA